ncbi:MAG: diphosphate--fructose-6-phosphate 1-phosphotransferase [Bacillota bacterium]|nr:diphosphate--fructose-6-phosphate 1-phosphotransferase [Bacillota bacterium]
MKFKSLVYLQSGGPTAVINSSLYGAYMEARKGGFDRIYGSMHGIEGLINDDLIDLEVENRRDIELLKQTPGAILGSSRYKLPQDLNDPVYDKIIETLRFHEIGYVCVNGGNDSMDTCDKLSKVAKRSDYPLHIMGVPKTVDNDLVATDHSVGFPSAAKYVINTIHGIMYDGNSYSVGKVYVMECMGRDVGWITASSDLLSGESRPDLIILPEVEFDLEALIEKVKKIHAQKNHVFIVVSEGIKFDKGEVVEIDSFGHAKLGGVGTKLANIIRERTGLSTRDIVLGLPQRGGICYMSKVDQEEAIGAGAFAVKSLRDGESGKMVAIRRVSNSPYKSEFFLTDVSKIANSVKAIPPTMIHSDRQMDPSFADYLFPLIQGEPELVYEDGVLLFSRFRYVKAY